MNRSSLTIFLSISLFLQSPYAHSFEIGTHRELSQRVVRLSNLDNIFKERFNFLFGVDDFVSNKRIIRWLEDGSDLEDNFPRFRNHFHNPLRTWDEAGLRIVLQVANSSILWGQSPGLQPSEEPFTWQDARENFFKGLTAPTQDQREEQLALTFRALG